MEKNLYVRFSDLSKSMKVSSDDFSFALGLAKMYNCIISVVSHRFGRTLYVGYSNFFFNSQLYL